MRRVIPFLVSGAVALSYAAAYADVRNELFKLLPEDGAKVDLFGVGVAIDGSTAIVGALFDDDNGDKSGSAYLFDVTTGRQLTKLLPDDGGAYELFGISVAIDVPTAIVGAYYDAENGPRSGSAYLFDTATGRQIAKLLADDGAAWDQFGRSVAISDAIVIVGADGDGDNGPNSGSAYLFDAVTGQQITKLLPDDGAEADRFGASVAISGAIAIVGAYTDDDNGPASGSAYLFDVSDPANPVQTEKLLADDGGVRDWFGCSVAISGATAIVGAQGHDDNGDDSGAAYVFDVTTGRQIVKLLPHDGAADDRFGSSVALSGETAIIGAILDSGNALLSGSAYLFDTTNGRQIVKLLASDGARLDMFGSPVAIDGATAVVGVRWRGDNGDASGSAYVFDTSSPGDLNCDRQINGFDIEPFLLALFDPDAYAAKFPDCDINLADVNCDGTIDAFDIGPFLELLFP